MKDKLLELIQRYWDKDDEYYSRYFYDENDNEFMMDKEIKTLFDSGRIEHEVKFTECFHSCGYDCDVLSIAWIESGKLYLHNVLLERM